MPRDEFERRVFDCARLMSLIGAEFRRAIQLTVQEFERAK